MGEHLNNSFHIDFVQQSDKKAVADVRQSCVLLRVRCEAAGHFYFAVVDCLVDRKLNFAYELEY